MIHDPGNPMLSSLTLDGGTLTFMAPELLAPPKFGLKCSAPTQESDIYAFGLVMLQVFLFCCHLSLFFPDVPPGPDRGGTISRFQTLGTRIPRIAWRSSGETCECEGYRDLRLLVGAHPEVLGR